MLEILLHTLKDRVRNTVRRECGETGRQRFNTSDVVQESLIQIWMSLTEPQILQLIECNGWLRKIALGHRAKLKRKHLAKKRSIFDEVHSEFVLASCSPAADVHVQQVEQVELVMNAVNQLPELDREIVVQYIFHDNSFLKIADELNRDPQFVRRHYKRAIKLLQQQLQDKGIRLDD